MATPPVIPSRSSARPPGGFTLPELLCAVVITLVLLTVALPAYREHRLAVARTDALLALREAAACQAGRRHLERQATLRDCLPAPTRAYRFLLVPTRAAGREGHEWRAEPRGDQRGDACGTLVLRDDGHRDALGAGWRRVRCWRGR